MKYVRQYIGRHSWENIVAENSILVPKTNEKNKWYCFALEISLIKDNVKYKNYDCYLICG